MRATQFLLGSQNTDGSWGGPQNAVYTFTGTVWSNPETHRAWKAGTTGLSCLALMKTAPSEQTSAALERGIDYLSTSVVTEFRQTLDVAARSDHRRENAGRLAHFRFIMVEVRAKQHRGRPMTHRRKIAYRRRN